MIDDESAEITALRARAQRAELELKQRTRDLIDVEAELAERRTPVAPHTLRDAVERLLESLAAQQAMPDDSWRAEWARLAPAFAADEPACDCDGGPQGEGLVSYPHEPHCATQRTRTP